MQSRTSARDIQLPESSGAADAVWAAFGGDDASHSHG